MLHPRLGTRKLKYLLCQNNIDIEQDCLFLLLKQHHLLVFNRRAYHRTINSHHQFHCHPNRIKEGMVPNKPEQLWVADITYLATRAGNTYLSLITGAYSKKIDGSHLDDNMKTQAVKSAFFKALNEAQKMVTESVKLYHPEEPRRHQRSNHHVLSAQNQPTASNLPKNNELNNTSLHYHFFPSYQANVLTYPTLWIYSYL